MRPLIGITSAHVEEEISTYPRQYYVDCVLQAGGLPILLPVVSGMADLYLDRIDGLILTGGGDVAPHLFNEEPVRGTGKVFPERDEVEIELVQKSMERDLPMLAICRGMQVLNIACGGTIYQDINSQVPDVFEHSQKAPRAEAWHSVELAPGTRLREIFCCETLRVNSFHHQAVKDIASEFAIGARSGDGVIEEIESRVKRFVIGVQWHPEAMVAKDGRFLALFKAMVRACSKNLAG